MVDSTRGTIEMSVERRCSFRYPVLGDRSSATLKAEGAEWPASLLDESASGFRVVATGRVPLEEGQLLELESDAGRCRVRVIRRASRPGRTELGLERLEDLPDPAAARGMGRTWFGQWRGWHRQPIHGVSLAVPVLIAALITGIGFWMASPRSPFSLSAGRESEPQRQAHDRAVVARRPAPGDSTPPGDFRERSIWGLRPTRAMPSPQADRGATGSAAGLETTVDQQFGQFFLLASQAAIRELELSAEQQEQIRRIREACAQRLSDAYNRRTPQDPQWLRESEEILQQGIRRAGEVLTGEQQARWKSMSSKP